MTGLRIATADSPIDPAGLSTLLLAMRDVVVMHRWSLSAAELWLVPGSPGKLQTLADRAADGVVWLTGAELLALAACVTVANWGAFLAFPLDAGAIDFTELPRSEGEISLVQHPQAVLEVQAIDGGSFEVFTRLPEVAVRLRERFLAVDAGGQ